MPVILDNAVLKHRLDHVSKLRFGPIISPPDKAKLLSQLKDNPPGRINVVEHRIGILAGGVARGTQTENGLHYRWTTLRI